MLLFTVLWNARYLPLANYYLQRNIIKAFGFSSFVEYFLKVKYIIQHTLFKQVARLIITGTVFIVLFGHGVHIHTLFDHLFDHGHIHVTLHAHPSDDHHSESGLSNLDTEDNHQHPIASIDINGTLKQSINQKEISNADIFEFAVSENVYSELDDGSPTLLAQPPPDLKLTQYHSLFFSLRAPPAV